jgi:glucose-1-phosphatase
VEIRLNNFDTIIFDLGNVIVDLYPQLVVERFLQHTPHAEKQINELIRDAQIHVAYEKGHLTTPEFVAAANEFLGASMSEVEFCEIWNLMIKDIPKPKLDLMQNLRKTHQVLILSNTNEMHEHHFDAEIKKLYNRGTMASHVDHAIYSHLIGMRKPKLDIYQYVIDNHLKDPSKALFLDDKLENVEGAIDAGIQSVQVIYPDQIFEILSK